MGPRDASTLCRLDAAQSQFQSHKDKYEKLRADVAIKLKFLEENKVGRAAGCQMGLCCARVSLGPVCGLHGLTAPCPRCTCRWAVPVQRLGAARGRAGEHPSVRLPFACCRQLISGWRQQLWSRPIPPCAGQVTPWPLPTIPGCWAVGLGGCTLTPALPRSR